jgi:arabinose-5-phosphate isomerase
VSSGRAAARPPARRASKSAAPRAATKPRVATTIAGTAEEPERRSEGAVRSLDTADLSSRAREVFDVEARALASVASRIGSSFDEAVAHLSRAILGGGKILVTGIGKSGLIGKKIAATLNSTGASALFLHPVEALHGDLGIVRAEDAVIAISKSGSSDELEALVPTFKRLGTPIIAMTGNVESPLARWADVVLDVRVPEEACGYDMIPTSSTTATLVMGDALAVALFDVRGLRPTDFAENHPGGALGRRLLLKVSDVMHRPPDMPYVEETATIERALVEILDKRLGVTIVGDGEGRLAGILTDGDLKRILLERGRANILRIAVGEVMTRSPKTIEGGELVARALKKMEERPNKRITCLVVVDKSGRPEGLIHLYDCLKAGIS